MAWSPPPTFTTGQTLTAAHMNTLRDNLNETAPAKAIITANATHFAGNGVNSIAQREVKNTTIDTQETTTLTTYDDLPAGTVGPSVTITTGSFILTWHTCQMSNSSANLYCAMSYETPSAVANDSAAFVSSNAASESTRASVCTLTGATPGSNIYTAKYKVEGGTGTFLRRRLTVMAF